MLSLCSFNAGFLSFPCSSQRDVSCSIHGGVVFPPSISCSSSPASPMSPHPARPRSISSLFAPSSVQLFYPTECLDAYRPEFSRGKLLSELSTLGVGGPAKFLCEVNDELQLASALRYCVQQGICFLVIGKGSNCLFDDLGFEGCIILNRICFLQKVGYGVYRVGSGYPYNVLGMQCAKDGFTGLEFASGIPGTVGGAVFMNAGANGQETAGTLKSVEVVTTDGNKHLLLREELSYSYRSSPFQKLQGFAAITAATFELKPSSTCREYQKTYLERRRRTQPVTERTAGCVFRNPDSGSQSAGSLVEQAGLKGVAIGGAKVSELHANFLVNVGGSRSKDVISLISLVKEQVRTKFAVDLKEEIIYVPPR